MSHCLMSIPVSFRNNRSLLGCQVNQQSTNPPSNQPTDKSTSQPKKQTTNQVNNRTCNMLGVSLHEYYKRIYFCRHQSSVFQFLGNFPGRHIIEKTYVNWEMVQLSQWAWSTTNSRTVSLRPGWQKWDACLDCCRGGNLHEFVRKIGGSIRLGM